MRDTETWHHNHSVSYDRGHVVDAFIHAGARLVAKCPLCHDLSCV